MSGMLTTSARESAENSTRGAGLGGDAVVGGGEADVEQTVADQDLVPGGQLGVLGLLGGGRRVQGHHLVPPPHVDVAVASRADDPRGLPAEIHRGMFRSHHDRVGVELRLGDLAGAGPDRGAVPDGGLPVDVVVARLVGQDHPALAGATDLVVLAPDHVGRRGGAADLSDVGPAVDLQAPQVAILEALPGHLDLHIAVDRDLDVRCHRSTSDHDPLDVGDQRHRSTPHLEGGGGVLDVGAQLPPRSEVDVVALHERGEVHLLQQGAALLQGEDPLRRCVGDDRLAAEAGVGRHGGLSLEATVVEQHRRGDGRHPAGRSALPRGGGRHADVGATPRPPRCRSGAGGHGGCAGRGPARSGGRGIDHREDEVGQRLPQAGGQGQHARPPLVGAGDLVLVLQIGVDDVDEGPIGVLPQSVQCGLLQRWMTEVVQPVVAQGEQDLVVVEPADLLVALPHPGQVHVDPDDGVAAPHRAGVQVGEQTGDELAPGQVQRVAPEAR